MPDDLFAPMSAKQFLSIIGKLDLSTADVSRMLGLSTEMTRRYATGQSPIPIPVAATLRYVLARRPKNLAQFKVARGPAAGRLTPRG